MLLRRAIPLALSIAAIACEPSVPFDASAHPNESKRRLARLLVARFVGEQAAEAAEQHFDRLFREHEAPEDMPEVQGWTWTT